MDAWVCDGYYVDIRYLADVTAVEDQIWDLQIALRPLPPPADVSFATEVPGYCVGQRQLSGLTKTDIVLLIEQAIAGSVKVTGRSLSLVRDQPLAYYSEMLHRDRWFSELHLQVLGDRRPQPAALELAAIDNALRNSAPPFDGLSDVTAWLGLRAPDAAMAPPSITLRVGPPVDLIFDQCQLTADELRLTLHAHPLFDVSRLGLAVRAVPGLGLTTRRQVADQVRWGAVKQGRRKGTVKVKLKDADNVLAMVQIEGSPVRRQWFIDPARARNNRLAAVQHYDRELKMLRYAVLESPESVKFEQGVATLLFLLGFASALQLETDAPDIVVTTPGGKLAVVECTTRIADFGMKIGKLVDRRGSLSKHLLDAGHVPHVTAVLVCRLPRERISAHERDLRSHSVLLVSGEELREGLDRVRTPLDPDRLLEDALARLESAAAPLNSQRA